MEKKKRQIFLMFLSSLYTAIMESEKMAKGTGIVYFKAYKMPKFCTLKIKGLYKGWGNANK